MACAIPHCEHAKERIGRLPASFAADAGYGSEGNYAYVEREGSDAYVKHSELFRERRNEKWRDDEMGVANWAHDENSDEHACPEGRTLASCGESRRVSDLGYESAVRTYEREDCPGCSRRASVSVNIVFTIFANVFSPIAPTRFRRIRQRGCAAFGA